jgi:hypothetical protein
MESISPSETSMDLPRFGVVTSANLYLSPNYQSCICETGKREIHVLLQGLCWHRKRNIWACYICQTECDYTGHTVWSRVIKSPFFILAVCFVGVFCLISFEVCKCAVILELFASQPLTEAGTKQSRCVVNIACGARCRVRGEYLPKDFTARREGGR